MTTILRGCVGAISSAAVIHALQAAGVRVVGMDSDSHSAGFRLCETSYQVPDPSEPGYIDAILKICHDEEVDAILPSAEEEILALACNRVLLLGGDFKLICPSGASCMRCADKGLTHQYFDEAGIPSPKIYRGRYDVEFPAIVKPPMGRGSKGVDLVISQRDLDVRLSKGPNVIFQEYIEGTRWAIDTLADWDGTILSMVTRRTILMQSGSTTKGITERDEEAMGYAERIVHDLHLTGPSIIEYIRGPDGIRFLEINTRFGGGAALSIAADPTLIPNLVRMVTGEDRVPSRGFTEGLEMLRYYSEVFIPRRS